MNTILTLVLEISEVDELSVTQVTLLTKYVE